MKYQNVPKVEKALHAHGICQKHALELIYSTEFKAGILFKIVLEGKEPLILDPKDYQNEPTFVDMSIVEIPRNEFIALNRGVIKRGVLTQSGKDEFRNALAEIRANADKPDVDSPPKKHSKIRMSSHEINFHVHRLIYQKERDRKNYLEGDVKLIDTIINLFNIEEEIFDKDIEPLIRARMPNCDWVYDKNFNRAVCLAIIEGHKI
jgi:hypothetical protein